MQSISREQLRNLLLPGERLAMVRFIFSWLVDEAKVRGSEHFELTPNQLRKELLLARHFPLMQSLEILQSRGIIFLKKEIKAGRVKKVSIALKMEVAQSGQKKSA